MKQKGSIIYFLKLLFIAISANVFASNNAPIQRIDVANMLWNNVAGATMTQTPVVVAFENGGTTPCTSVTIPFNGFVVVWAGIGQACISPITSITITPVVSPGMGTVYAAPNSTTINSSYYSTQVIINQATAPVFNPSNGTISTSGTVQVSTTTHFKNSDI